MTYIGQQGAPLAISRCHKLLRMFLVIHKSVDKAYCTATAQYFCYLRGKKNTQIEKRFLYFNVRSKICYSLKIT